MATVVNHDSCWPFSIKGPKQLLSNGLVTLRRVKEIKEKRKKKKEKKRSKTSSQKFNLEIFCLLLNRLWSIWAVFRCYNFIKARSCWWKLYRRKRFISGIDPRWSNQLPPFPIPPVTWLFVNLNPFRVNCARGKNGSIFAILVQRCCW